MKGVRYALVGLVLSLGCVLGQEDPPPAEVITPAVVADLVGQASNVVMVAGAGAVAFVILARSARLVAR